MKSDTELFEQIINLIAKHTLLTSCEISLSSRLGEDLRLVGDDAEEFLKEFSEQFNLDLSDMNFNDYFPDEATADMHYYLCTTRLGKSKNKLMRIIRKLEARFWRLFARKTQFKSMTVEGLVAAARTGRWA